MGEARIVGVRAEDVQRITRAGLEARVVGADVDRTSLRGVQRHGRGADIVVRGTARSCDGARLGAEVLLADGDLAGRNAGGRTVERRQNVGRAGSGGRVGVRQQVQAVELGRTDHCTDLILQGVDVGLDLVTVDVFFLCRDDLLFHLVEKVGRGFGSRTGHRNGRFTQAEAVGDRLEAADVGFHDFRDRPDGRVVLGVGDAFTRRDLRLGVGHRAVDRFQGLQRDHCAVVGKNAGHASFP